MGLDLGQPGGDLTVITATSAGAFIKGQKLRLSAGGNGIYRVTAVHGLSAVVERIVRKSKGWRRHTRRVKAQKRR